jgi:hypothetical protein
MPLSDNRPGSSSASADSSISAEILKVSCKAGEVISALKIVRVHQVTEFATSVVIANNTDVDPSPYGIALTAAIMNASVDILQKGKIEDPFFNFPLHDELFLLEDGIVSNVPPTSGYHIQVGYSLGPGAIYIDINTPIKL